MSAGAGRRKVVNILLYDREKRFLLQLRTADAPVMPGYWAFFGGGVKRGESLRAALEREALEELNFRPTAAVLLAEKDFTLEGRKVRMHVFVQRYAAAKAALRLGEGAGWAWLSPEETGGLRMCARDRKMLKFLRSRIGRTRNAKFKAC